MDVKEQTRKAYELFGKGDMETFFNEMIDDNIVWTFPGKEGVHPLSGVHKGKQAMMAAMSKIPAIWPNFHLKILDMISEGNKVFVRVHATADNMDTMFGHYFESTDEGKTKVMMTFDDTLSMFNAMGKWDFSRNVIIEFPSYEIALKWYNSDEYKPIRQMRLDNAEGNLIIVKGI